MSKAGRYSTVFVGCACGDALGMPVETWMPERIKKYTGRITHFMDAIVIRDRDGNPLKRDEFGVINYWTKDFKKGEYLICMKLQECMSCFTNRI